MSYFQTMYGSDDLNTQFTDTDAHFGELVLIERKCIMSVLIKDMDMPRNCAECPFLYDGNACYAVNEPDSLFLPLVCNGRTGEYRVNEFPFHEKRVDWCPLVEVPSHRGDMIDSDLSKYMHLTEG